MLERGGLPSGYDRHMFGRNPHPLDGWVYEVTGVLGWIGRLGLALTIPRGANECSTVKCVLWVGSNSGTH